jgi:hypothetical protein
MRINILLTIQSILSYRFIRFLKQIPAIGELFVEKIVRFDISVCFPFSGLFPSLFELQSIQIELSIQECHEE